MVVIGRREVADRGRLDPSWPPSEPHFGAHPDFPDSFSTHSAE
jgi:hypothetical protein